MTWLEESTRVLPLQVSGHGITGSFFHLYGPEWSLAVNCDWTIRRRGFADVGWDADDPAIAETVARLDGRSIVRIEFMDDVVDPVITFDDRTELVVEADTDLDPWVLQAAGLSAVLVGRAATEKEIPPEDLGEFVDGSEP